MRDISARELKGHNILAVERFQDSTRWMVEFMVRKPRTPYGSPGDEVFERSERKEPEVFAELATAARNR